MTDKEIAVYDFFDYMRNIKYCNNIIGIYHVGSSVVNIDFSNDIDILFIADNSYPYNYKKEIINLKNKLFQYDVINGSFDATDNEIKQLLKDHKQDKKYVFEFEYIIGPMKKEFNKESDNNNSITLHICGPMKLQDYELFFNLFPFHSIAFLRYNINIFGIELNKIINKPFLSLEIYIKWQNSNYKRLNNIFTDSKKFKVLKTMLLTKYLFENSNDAYNEAYNKLNEYRNKYIDINMIIKYICEYCGCKYE